MTAAPARPSRRLAAAGVLLLTMAAIVLGASPASAHGDEGVLEVVSATPSGTSSVITVKLTYENDGEPVADATVTVAGDNGAGSDLAPVTMQPGSTGGEFTATVDFPAPGTWTLRVTSVKPEAAVTLTQAIASDPQVTTESAGGSTPTPGEPSTAPSETVDGGVPEITAEAASAQDENSGSPVWWIVGGVAAVAAVAVGVVFVARGRNQGPIDKDIPRRPARAGPGPL